MTSDPTWTPSEGLVDGLALLNAHRSGWLWDDASKHTRDVLRSDAIAALTAAVAYRTPTGDPELVPWEQVRELVDAARTMVEILEAKETILAPDPYDLRAALAPFTQEPHDANH